MNRRWTCFIITFVFLCPAFASADWADDDWWDDDDQVECDWYADTLLEEDFDLQTFPPTGWRLESTNYDNTWERIENAGNTEFNHEKFVYIKGSSAAPSDERLISPTIEYFDLSGCDYASYTFTYLTFLLGVSEYGENFDCTVEICHDPESNDCEWQKIWSYLEDGTAYQPYNMEYVTVEIPWLEMTGPFSIAFRYQGQEPTEVALDDVTMQVDDECCVTNESGGNSGGGSNSGGDSNSGNDNDDSSNSDDDNNDSSSSGSSCGISQNQSALMLMILMLIIGFSAMVAAVKKP